MRGEARHRSTLMVINKERWAELRASTSDYGLHHPAKCWAKMSTATVKHQFGNA